jgi:pilus assembly protein CpaE
MAAGQKVRVIIVDDIAETRENVRKLLQFEADIEVIGAAKSGKEGIEFSKEQDPDVVLMDINMPDMDGISATEAILRDQPHVQVIILSVQGDQNYMRRAMLAGARDFLTKPPMADELISAINRAGEMAQLERAKNALVRAAPTVPGILAGSGYSLTQGKVITVYSPKGGTAVQQLLSICHWLCTMKIPVLHLSMGIFSLAMSLYLSMSKVKIRL